MWSAALVAVQSVTGRRPTASASDCAQVVAFIECGLVACTSTPGCLPCQGEGEGVRTGGRLHPRLSRGATAVNNAPSSSRACPGGLAIAGAFAMMNLVSGSELEGMSSALRSIACLIACPPCPCSVFSYLPSPSGSLRGSTGPVACLFCVIVALGGFVPSALPGLGPSAFSLPDAGHSV